MFCWNLALSATRLYDDADADADENDDDVPKPSTSTASFVDWWQWRAIQRNAMICTDGNNIVVTVDRVMKENYDSIEEITWFITTSLVVMILLRLVVVVFIMVLSTIDLV